MEVNIYHSENISNISAALAKAQGEIENAIKDSHGYNYNYADLASVLEACKIPLSKTNIARIQIPMVSRENNDLVSVTVITILAHDSGEWFRGELKIFPKDASAQSIGSAITYARRYSLSSMVGIAPDKDDDGVAATEGGKSSSPKGMTSAPNTNISDPFLKPAVAGLKGRQAPLGGGAGSRAHVNQKKSNHAPLNDQFL